jgi:AcrR family transcriptional regulator
MDGKAKDSAGGPARRTALDLAWGWGERPRPGPRPSLKLEEIVDAAIALADAEGIEAVSMQRVAKRMGVTTMALYRYVGSKDDLLFLAVDAAAGQPPPSDAPDEPWRAAVERWARGQLDLLTAHPWVARLPISEPPLGPNQVAWMECLLEDLAGSGLSLVDQLGVMNLVAGFVAGHFRLYAELSAGALARGRTREEAERRYMETIGQVIGTARFPHVASAFAAASEAPSTDARADFEFGLARILDGIEVMGRRSRS